MPISQLDLAKFQEYKARQKTTSRSVPASANSQKPNSQNENGQNGQNSNHEKLPDLISFCVEDILAKLEEVDFYKGKNEGEKDNFKSVLYSDFLSEIANNLIRNLLEMSKNSNNYYGLNTLLETENPKEFFGNLATIISFVPELAANFVEYTVAIYLGLCTKFYILADSQILSLTKTLA
jgi:hypothetical protein